MTDSIATLHAAFECQHKASRREPFPSFAERCDRITRMEALLVDQQQRLCDAVAADFGRRSADNTRMFDILPPLHALRYARKNLRRWIQPQRRRSNFPYNLLGARSEIHYTPLGVVGNISPWNFPVTLALSPMGGILAAGNRVLIKPSEFTPATAATLKELIGNYFDASEIAVVNGDAAFSAEFSRLPFDHLLFTGSTAVARHIASAAAPNLTPLTLELGGKSPVVVSDSADLNDVARKVLFAKTMNAGQICLAPDYLVIRRDRRDALVEAIRQVAKDLFPRGAASDDYVNIINARHAQRLRNYLQDAQQRGNRVLSLFSEEIGFSGVPDTRSVPPHLVLIEGEGGSILEEEIFGPLLPIVAADSFADTLNIIGRHSRPLALYYLGNDRREIETLINAVPCGGMVVNDLLVHFLQDDLPFGGIGDSGMGNYHGPEGFLRFSHAKSVFRQSRIDIGALLRPPYGKSFRALLDMQIKK